MSLFFLDFIASINFPVPERAIVPRLSIRPSLDIPMPLSSISIIFFFFETLILINKSLFLPRIFSLDKAKYLNFSHASFALEINSLKNISLSL